MSRQTAVLQNKINNTIGLTPNRWLVVCHYILQNNTPILICWEEVTWTLFVMSLSRAGDNSDGDNCDNLLFSDYNLQSDTCDSGVSF